MLVGALLVIGGFLGFLPVLGFWMIPLGLLILSIDLPAVRKKRRQWTVKFGRWLSANYPAWAARFGFTQKMKESGGLARNRTGVDGFAGRCVTTPPRGRGV